jgi:hypothetical protein
VVQLEVAAQALRQARRCCTEGGDTPAQVSDLVPRRREAGLQQRHLRRDDGSQSRQSDEHRAGGGDGGPQWFHLATKRPQRSEQLQTTEGAARARHAQDSLIDTATRVIQVNTHSRPRTHMKTGVTLSNNNGSAHAMVPPRMHNNSQSSSHLVHEAGDVGVGTGEVRRLRRLHVLLRPRRRRQQRRQIRAFGHLDRAEQEVHQRYVVGVATRDAQHAVGGVEDAAA